jgi:cysteine desulfurase
MSDRIYLDHNATTPVAREVAASMQPFLAEVCGNPSSLHWAGISTRDAVEAARSQVAALLCCDATEVVFTSGGTEANNHALKGAFYASLNKFSHPHFITSQIEHPSVLETCRFVEELGADVSYLPVDRLGQVDPDDVRDAIREETVLISVMHANNETGVIQPVPEIATMAGERGIPFHSDGAQSVGKISVDVESMGMELLSIAGHKFYGPKGVGALFIREGTAIASLLHGAGHEARRRAGTENVPAIVGLGAACELARRWLEQDDPEVLREYFWRRLQQTFGDAVALNGHPAERLPNTLNVSFIGLLGCDILAKMPSVAASTGAACHAGKAEMSAVLEAMGTDKTAGLGAIRFSLGRDTTTAELDRVIELLAVVVERRLADSRAVRVI